MSSEYDACLQGMPWAEEKLATIPSSERAVRQRSARHVSRKGRTIFTGSWRRSTSVGQTEFATHRRRTHRLSPPDTHDTDGDEVMEETTRQHHHHTPNPTTFLAQIRVMGERLFATGGLFRGGARSRHSQRLAENQWRRELAAALRMVGCVLLNPLHEEETRSPWQRLRESVFRALLFLEKHADTASIGNMKDESGHVRH